MSQTAQCKNCEKKFDASFDYCPYCGQEAADNLTIGVLFSNTISNYFSIDARFFKSFIPLMTKPGVLARRFVDGKRLSYLHPAQFYLFVSVLFFFIFSFTIRKADTEMSKALEEGLNREVPVDSISAKVDSVGIAIAKDALKKNQVHTGMTDEEIQALDSVFITGTDVSSGLWGSKKGELDSLIANDAPQSEKLKAIGMKEDAGVFTTKVFTQMLKFYEQRGGGILKTLYDIIPIAMFILLPLFALLLKIFYWRRGTFAHHMVFSFYFFTFIFMTFCVLILANMLFEIPLWIEIPIIFSQIIYLIIALHNFYNSSWIGAFFKANIISFAYMLFVLPLAISGLIFVSFMLY
ncbi:DUF3667 domain-containing protein [Poritiphilus flavus]|uniref:DUF3667 domain-containing protein n=1 Tax=Poritiphilus flavus TaxID=2697053 RepID=A0A6L9EF85_9FLAO|nr:DUF3667 domain-containing protein [Poritiphilus flavus]NAS13313.1 DUF3667 domain-containing protein [Poritiphilus flavus]